MESFETSPPKPPAELRLPPKPFPWRGMALAAGILAGIAEFVGRWSGWSGSWRWGRAHAFHVILAVCGIALLVGVGWAWWSDRRRDPYGEPLRRRGHAAGVALGAWLLLLLPLGHLVMRWSASVSKARGEEVAAAAEKFHAAKGRWPETTKEIEDALDVRLPAPTLAPAYQLYVNRSGALRVGFYTYSFTYSYSWEYDLGDKSWHEASK